MELTGKDVRFQFEKAASYEICMIVVNGAETCKDQICKKITVGNRINVFPNPSADILNITVDENISKLTIYDQFNRVVHSGNLYDTYGNIDITHLNSGLYTVTVQLENGELMAKKFYKQQFLKHCIKSMFKFSSLLLYHENLNMLYILEKIIVSDPNYYYIFNVNDGFYFIFEYIIDLYEIIY